ncbi:RRXRR domain-containing protein [Anabaena lutea]|nr:RRXRR domain-containing protein [Anabaena lutea]
MRVPVIAAKNIPLMPTKPSRARRWIKSGIAIGKFNKLGIFYVQLIAEPSDIQTQKKSFFGWVSGDTEKHVSVSDCNWKRFGQCTAKKVRLIQRNTGLIVLSTRKMFNLMASNH